MTLIHIPMHHQPLSRRSLRLWAFSLLVSHRSKRKCGKLSRRKMIASPGLCRYGNSFTSNSSCADLHLQPFVSEHQPSIEALKKMGDSLDKELRTLLLYYGEVADGPDARRPEDLFGMILSFSSSLQVRCPASAIVAVMANILEEMYSGDPRCTG